MTRTNPFRRSFLRPLALLAMIALLAAACSDDSGADGNNEAGGGANVDGPDTSEPVATSSTTSTLPGTTAPIPEDGVALIDLQVTFVEFGEAGFVEITNRGDSDIDLNGVFLCQRPVYVDLGTVVDGGSLAAGATARIPASELGGLDAAAGEAALYQGNSFASADAILSYVQWGEGGQGRVSVAVEAGLWPSVDDAVTPDPAFNSIESGGDPADPETWS
jgi:hypothetical protein